MTEHSRIKNSQKRVKIIGLNTSNNLLIGLNTLRKENTFTDVSIKVDDREFPVHKCVLSSFSPYFKAMFTAGLAETGQNIVTLNGKMNLQRNMTKEQK